MIESVYTVIIIASIFSIVVLTIAFILMMHRVNADAKLHMTIVSELAHRNQVLQNCRDREREIGAIFSKLLFDLSTTQNKESIQWKLMCIRHIRDALKHSYAGVYYSDNFAQWLRSIIDNTPPQSQEEALQLIRKWAKGYYVMDMESGENLCDLIEQIMRMEQTRNADEHQWKEEFTKLLHMVSSMNFKLPMVDTAPIQELEEVVHMTFEELLTEIDSNPIWDITVKESDDANNMHSGTEEDCGENNVSTDDCIQRDEEKTSRDINAEENYEKKQIPQVICVDN